MHCQHIDEASPVLKVIRLTTNGNESVKQEGNYL